MKVTRGLWRAWIFVTVLCVMGTAWVAYVALPNSAGQKYRRSRTHIQVNPPGMPCRLSHLSKPSRCVGHARPVFLSAIRLLPKARP
jgi:hypothetical protein